jgi:hypothetical protein
MVFEISLYPGFFGTNNKNNSLYQLVQSLLANVQVSKDIKLDNYIITEIIQEKYNNDMANINQSKDDIFNIYMYGYLKSKERIFENFIALPSN